MANCVTALRLVSPAPAPVPQIQIERAIGEAVASCATALCVGVEELHAGGLRPSTKMESGERIAKLFWLRQGAPADLDFEVAARREGGRVLRSYFDADFYRRHGPDAGETMIDALITETLAVVDRVTAFMAN